MKPAVKRCAIYTRKSSEEGLDQAFNSLDAQREACAAYVHSQAGEGWQASPKLYDDGGFSGGNIERPALKAMLADVDAGRIDVIVVYKVDRLTRSLSDFAKIVDRLDAAGASFVSVTQAFNTTNSMGRLTLNVLLSFAQFEREVTSERIRDKIALSKAKGMWMGGTLPLGYDVKDRKLTINQAEAETVRHIFRRYLDLRSVNSLRDELNRAGLCSKIRTTAAGKTLGGVPFNRGSLYHLLQSRIYVGEIPHRDKHFPGEHSAILDLEVFEAVQAQIALNRQVATDRPVRSAQCALLGKVFDAAGNRMSPSFGYGKSGKPYRYYISMNLQVGKKPAAEHEIRRVSASGLEDFVVQQLNRVSNRTDIQSADLGRVVERVEIGLEDTQIVGRLDELAPGQNPTLAFDDLLARVGKGGAAAWERKGQAIRVRFPLRLQLRGGRTWFDGSSFASDRAKPNAGLVHGLRSAHRTLDDLLASPTTEASKLGEGAAPTTPHARQLSRLAFLAPDLQQAVLSGAHPTGLKLRAVLKSELPLAWADQPQWLTSLAMSAR